MQDRYHSKFGRRPRQQAVRGLFATSPYTRRLRAELLEDRRMLAVLTVNSLADNTLADGWITLREAIHAANNDTIADAVESVQAGSGDDVILFDTSVFTGGSANLIRLTQGQLQITDTVTVDGADVFDTTGEKIVISGDVDGNDHLIDGTLITDVESSAAANLLEDNTRVFNFSPSTNLIGTEASPLDPLLGPLADNGGPTLTHALLPGSPALNAGASTEIFDQRGLPRNVNGVDMGAYEAQNPSSVDFDLDGDVDGGPLAVEERSLASTMEFDDTTQNLVVDLALDELDGIYTTGDLSLREAIFLANTNPGPDTITFAADVFTGGSASLIRLTQGELEITETLTIDGSTALEIVISGDAEGNDILMAGTLITNVALSSSASLLDDNTRVFNFSSPHGDLTLQSLTITGGRTTVYGVDGAGICFGSDGLLTLTGSTVSGNSSGGDGGGIYTSSGAVELMSSTVSGNSSSHHGGGISTSSGSVMLISSTVSGNSCRSRGGGINNYFGSVVLASSTVSGNSTTGSYARGGGIFIGAGSVMLTSSTVSNNSATGTYSAGGGIIGRRPSLITIENSIVAGNLEYKSSPSDNGTLSDLSSGGALFINHSLIGVADRLWISGAGNLALDNLIITGGHATDFGTGSGIRFSSGGALTLTDSMVNGNSATGMYSQGVGISTHSGSVMLTGSTVSDNSSESGGGGIRIVQEISSATSGVGVRNGSVIQVG